MTASNKIFITGMTGTDDGSRRRVFRITSVLDLTYPGTADTLPLPQKSTYKLDPLIGRTASLNSQRIALLKELNSNNTTTASSPSSGRYYHCDDSTTMGSDATSRSPQQYASFRSDNDRPPTINSRAGSVAESVLPNESSIDEFTEPDLELECRISTSQLASPIHVHVSQYENQFHQSDRHRIPTDMMVGRRRDDPIALTIIENLIETKPSLSSSSSSSQSTIHHDCERPTTDKQRNCPEIRPKPTAASGEIRTIVFFDDNDDELVGKQDQEAVVIPATASQQQESSNHQTESSSSLAVHQKYIKSAPLNFGTYPRSSSAAKSSSNDHKTIQEVHNQPKHQQPPMATFSQQQATSQPSSKTSPIKEVAVITPSVIVSQSSAMETVGFESEKEPLMKMKMEMESSSASSIIAGPPLSFQSADSKRPQEEEEEEQMSAIRENPDGLSSSRSSPSTSSTLTSSRQRTVFEGCGPEVVLSNVEDNVVMEDDKDNVSNNGTQSESDILTKAENARASGRVTKIRMMFHANVQGMDCYGNDREALADFERFFNNATFSDVTLLVGEVIFYAHRLILIKASEVFERFLRQQSNTATTGGTPSDTSLVEKSSTPSVVGSTSIQSRSLTVTKTSAKSSAVISEPSENVEHIELIEDRVCAKVFPAFLRFLYCNHIVLHIDNTLPLLILADKYNVVHLRKVCIDYAVTNIIPSLSLKDIFHIWFQYGTKCFHQELINVCIQRLSAAGDEMIGGEDWEKDWLAMDRDQLFEFLKCSDLTVTSEFELWKAVSRWIEAPSHPERHGAYTEKIISQIVRLIRFPFMTPDELSQMEANALVNQYPRIFNSHIMGAYKFQALPLASRVGCSSFTGLQYVLRNYSDLRWDKRITVPEVSSMLKYAKCSVKMVTRASALQVQNWDWVLTVHPKGVSASQEEFKVTLTSNVMLDQTRSVEYLLSIVDDEKVLRSVAGKKSFSKTRYHADLEMEKRVGLEEILSENSPLLVNDCLQLQLTLKPID